MSLAAVANFRPDPLASYDPIAGMVPFHQSQSALRLLRAPNQIGKTWAGCAEDWWFLTDTHPWRRRKKGPVKLWIMLADLENQYREFCEKLHALEPLDCLAPGCNYIEGEGYRYRQSRQVMLRNGSQIVFRSGEGSQIAVSSGTADALHIDEPPKQPHFLEACRAVLHRDGPIWMTMTPVGRPVHWLKLRVEGDPANGIAPAEPWEQHVPLLTLDNVRTHRTHRLTRTAESIDKQIRRYLGTPEYKQRCEGAWEGVATGRRFPGFDPGSHIFDDYDDLPGFRHLRVGFDYGESSATQVGYLVALTSLHTPTIAVLAEIPGVDRGTPATDAAALYDALSSLGLTLHDLVGEGNGVWGDINSAGKAGAGVSVNSLLAAAIANLPGSPRPPLEVNTPNKRGGSVRAGESALSTAATEDRLLVHRSCHRLLNSLQYYTGTESDLKHPLDALRYPLSDILLATQQQGSKPPTLMAF